MGKRECPHGRSTSAGFDLSFFSLDIPSKKSILSILVASTVLHQHFPPVHFIPLPPIFFVQAFACGGPTLRLNDQRNEHKTLFLTSVEVSISRLFFFALFCAKVTIEIRKLRAFTFLQVIFSLHLNDVETFPVQQMNFT